MKDAAQNPFNITKAVDFSDQEIHDYWVDMPTGDSFSSMAKPTSPMPMLIVGGKGSGKTHLMRYFSYPLQRIRHGRDLLEGIRRDGYIGIYLRCGGLNSARFRGKGQPDEKWDDVFAYYMELWLSQLVLGTALDAVGEMPEVLSREPNIVRDLLSLVDLREHTSPKSLWDLNLLLRGLQKELDVAVNNSGMTGKLPVHITVTRGDLIFGIPKVFAANLSPFRDCLFLYLLDEFENLSEVQQRYIQTLIRERQNPCSFKIGARTYGIRTLKTYSADEENKEGSEFEVLPLDTILRANDRYQEFAKRLVAKRLAEFNRVPSNVETLNSMAQSLDKHFEEFEKSPFGRSETAFVTDKYVGRDRPYFKTLRQNLEKGLDADAARGLSVPDEIEKAIALLRCPEFPLLEKVNIFIFYREWSKCHNLQKAAKEIADDCRAFLAGTLKHGRYQTVLEYFRADLLAQLLRETDQRQRYVGLTTFVEISSGFPRNLLIILKHIFAWATFNGEFPFRGTPISIRSQQAGVLEASEWFYRDSRMIGRQGQHVMDGINRLGTLFRGIRFSEKPSECSCCTFSSDLSRCTDVARRVVDLADKWSLLINVGGQRDRNTERVDAKYQLNPMLAPRWDLAIYRRGVLALTPEEIDAAFNPEHAGKFDEFAEKRIARMAAPFFGHARRPLGGLPPERTQSLFADGDYD
jgi:hypothetical protein